MRTGLLVASFVVLLYSGGPGNAATTAGEKLDDALATGERKLDNLRAESRTLGERLSDTASEIGGKITDVAGDAGITTRVKTRLAGDAALNALKIDVDTHDRRVTLNGTAPNAAARDRATTLTLSTDGVLAVDNRLRIPATVPVR